MATNQDELRKSKQDPFATRTGRVVGGAVGAVNRFVGAPLRVLGRSYQGLTKDTLPDFMHGFAGNNIPDEVRGLRYKPRKKPGKAAAAAAAVAPAVAATPAATPTATPAEQEQQTPVGLNRSQTAPVAATAAPAAANPYGGSFVDRLARFREQFPTAQTPDRATADRGFQYQPSQWAQQTALRNAMVGNTNTVYDKRGRKVGEEFDQGRFEALMAADPRLQGLARSKMFQDNVTTDLNAATTQRGQDITARGQDLDFQGQVNTLRSGERVATERAMTDRMGQDKTLAGTMADTLARREIAEGNNLASRYATNVEAQQAGLDRAAKERQQNFENTEKYLQNRYQTSDGQFDAARANEARRMLTNSGVIDAPVPVQEMALSFADQFARASAEGQALSQSGAAAFMPLIGSLFRQNPQNMRSVQQMEGALLESLKEPRIVSELGLSKNDVDFLTKLLSKKQQ